MTTKTEIIPIEKPDLPALFSVNGLDTILADIEEKARSLVPDVETAKGRKEIASVAASVARSKTYLDGLGKDYVSELKKKTKAIDTERKRARDFLDALKAEIRAPLVEWENREVQRIQALQNRLFNLTMPNVEGLDTDAIQAQIDRIQGILIDDTWQEFRNDAEKEKNATLYQLMAALNQRKLAEEEARKAEEARREAEEKARKELEERIAREAAEKARREAEEKAQREAEEREAIIRAEREQQEAEARRAARLLTEEKVRIERERQEAEERARIAEEKRIRAEELAKLEAEQAAQRERERIAEEQRQAEEERQARERDKRHRVKVLNAVHEALTDHVGQLTPHTIDCIITAIIDGKIPHTSIEF